VVASWSHRTGGGSTLRSLVVSVADAETSITATAEQIHEAAWIVTDDFRSLVTLARGAVPTSATEQSVRGPGDAPRPFAAANSVLDVEPSGHPAALLGWRRIRALGLRQPPLNALDAVRVTRVVAEPLGRPLAL
jgi:hypothetical protein